MNSRRTLWILVFAAVFFGLIALLTAVESAAENATITSFSNALWYTLTTLTTVGYGDCYPVTTAGRFIGGFFQLCSIGVLAAVISVLISAFRGTLLPYLQLSMLKKREWYIFTQRDKASKTLAVSLVGEDPSRVILFTGDNDDSTPGMRTTLSPERLIRMKGMQGILPLIDTSGSYQPKQDAKNVYYYLQSSYEPKHLSDHIILFDPDEILARLYWQKYPADLDGETIMIIGSGRAAETLLEQALLVNVTGQGHFSYYVYGNYERFLRLHPRLSEFISLNQNVGGKDALYIKEEGWDDDEYLLRNADRIIFLDENEKETNERLTQFLRYFAAQGTIYGKTDSSFDGVIRFGSTEEIYSSEYVLRTSLNRTAKLLHECYRRETGGTAPSWNELDSFKRRSNLASADHLPTKIRLLLPDEDTSELSQKIFARAYQAFEASDGKTRDLYRKIEHERWSRFHYLHNWNYSPVRNDDQRLHPCLVPYDKLSQADKEKDDYSWEVLRYLAK